MLCDSLDGRGVWEKMETYICMPEFLHCSPETITTLFVNQLCPNTNKKLKKGTESGKGRKPVKGVLSQRALRSVLWGNPGK